MNQKVVMNFEVEKNGRTYVFSVENNSPIADAFEVAKELMIMFSTMGQPAEEATPQDAQDSQEGTPESEAVEAAPDNN